MLSWLRYDDGTELAVYEHVRGLSIGEGRSELYILCLLLGVGLASMVEGRGNEADHVRNDEGLGTTLGYQWSEVALVSYEMLGSFFSACDSHGSNQALLEVDPYLLI